jgi:hypothetical protein
MAKLTDTQLIMLSKAAAWLGRERLSRVSSKQCRIRRKPSIAARLSYRRARGRRGNHSTGVIAVRPLRASSKVNMIACEAPKILDAPIVSVDAVRRGRRKTDMDAAVRSEHWKASKSQAYARSSGQSRTE